MTLMTKKNLKTLFALFGGLLGVVYILNPTAGIIEFIPDNLPFIGNLDEAAAVVLILGCLRHFNIDLTSYFKK
ncbi:MAG: DUF1232 domain-containing protein [Bacteriovoracaceae bacterium]|nr:DUF1232 domain-containing protein [Bacteriovoracaceae bacterium]